jgi:hypothetical protein
VAASGRLLEICAPEAKGSIVEDGVIAEGRHGQVKVSVKIFTVFTSISNHYPFSRRLNNDLKFSELTAI